MKDRTHFAHRIEELDARGEVREHLAGVEDYEVAEATWLAAIARWPAARITLRQGRWPLPERGRVTIGVSSGFLAAATSKKMRPRPRNKTRPHASVLVSLSKDERNRSTPAVRPKGHSAKPPSGLLAQEAT